MEPFALEMKNMYKSFPGVVALSDVTLQVKKGEVHALMGENGAGKSTLMKILAGVYKPDRGDIFLNGQKVELKNPLSANQHGISMIYQELSFIPELTVAENIFLGREPRYPYTDIVNRRKLMKDTVQLLNQLDIHLDPARKISSLTIAEMQMVEIAKALSTNSDIIVMDEPTSAITDREVEKLFEIIKMLTGQGKSIIYISHKMDEIFEICDSITVLRDGCFIDSKPAEELDIQKLIKLMVGRDLQDIYPKKHTVHESVYFEIKNLSRKNKFRNISFTVRKGEIIGLSGLVGAGRTELAESIFGVHPPDQGEMVLEGRQVSVRSPKDAIAHHIALVTEDRKLFGLNLKGSVKDNMSLVSLRNFSKLNQIISEKKEIKAADEQIDLLKIKTSSRNTIVNTLSGGNQQKIVLAKWLLNAPNLLILDEPTRGIDIGAKFEIYKIINELAEKGKSIIVISSEMPELLGLCDKIIVMCQGEMTGEFAREEFNQEHIMACSTGHLKGELAE